jgi:hypothetical protein
MYYLYNLISRIKKKRSSQNIKDFISSHIKFLAFSPFFFSIDWIVNLVLMSGSNEATYTLVDLMSSWQPIRKFEWSRDIVDNQTSRRSQKYYESLETIATSRLCYYFAIGKKQQQSNNSFV